MKLVVIAVVLFASLAALGILGVMVGSIPTYKYLSDFLAAEQTGGRVAISGKIASIESVMPQLRFTIHDRDDERVTLSVRSDKSPPENFYVGREVGLRGTFDSDTRIFDAYRIETACPSRYKATEEVEMSGTGGAGPQASAQEVAPPATTSAAASGS